MYSLVFLLVILITPSFTQAANISSPSYAWSESVGWVKFDSGVGAVTVSDSALSGHAYNDNIGWVVLSGVLNDGEGTLSGYAWSESVGYIDFSDVTILDGQFYGYAYNDNIGFISFSCANTETCGDVDYGVSTTWAPAVAPEPEEEEETPRRGGGSSGSRRTTAPTTAPATTVPTTPPTPATPATSASPELRRSLTTPTQRDLTLNATGQDVMNLQKFLNSQGFTVSLNGAGSPGFETSYFGALTRSALARFQAAKGISPAVGYFGPLTRAFIANMQ